MHEVKRVFGAKGDKKVEVVWGTGETSIEPFLHPYTNMTPDVGEHHECRYF